MLCYLGMSNLFDAPHSWTWCTLEQIYRICCSFPLHQQGFQLTWHRTRILLNNLILMILVWYRWSPTCIALCVSWNVTCLFDALDPPPIWTVCLLLDVLKLLKAHYTREDPNITIACQTTTQLGADIGFEPNVRVTQLCLLSALRHSWTNQGFFCKLPFASFLLPGHLCTQTHCPMLQESLSPILRTLSQSSRWGSRALLRRWSVHLACHSSTETLPLPNQGRDEKKQDRSEWLVSSQRFMSRLINPSIQRKFVGLCTHCSIQFNLSLI